MDIPLPPEDGSEPPPIDEDRKAAEFKTYDDFAQQHKTEIEAYALSLQEFRDEKDKASISLKPLWPVFLSSEEIERRQMKDQLR